MTTGAAKDRQKFKKKFKILDSKVRRLFWNAICQCEDHLAIYPSFRVKQVYTNARAKNPIIRLQRDRPRVYNNFYKTLRDPSFCKACTQNHPWSGLLKEVDVTTRLNGLRKFI